MLHMNSDAIPSPARRAILAAGAAAMASQLLPKRADGLELKSGPKRVIQKGKPPAGYNILFILVDEERFFPRWPIPVPAREWIKANGITFTNHQTAACVCSPARSTVYTGQHIQHSGIFDLLNWPWQPDLSTNVATIGHRLSKLGYYASYQGKWHLSANLDKTKTPFDAPVAEYNKTMESYGFKDFFGVGDLIDSCLGGYTYDDGTAAIADAWLRRQAQELKRNQQPWFLAVNFVNPHDTTYFNSDLPSQDVQGKANVMEIARTPNNAIYQKSWDQVPLPKTRHQPFDEVGRPKAQKIYQDVDNVLFGGWPDEDRRWRALQNYYFNAIRDCDRQVQRVLDSLHNNGLADDTIVVFTADHGELGGSHQMRDKGNCTYREQNHIPLMIVHPAYQGGKECAAITSQIDLVPTLIGLTGKDPTSQKSAAQGLKGKDFSGLLGRPEFARPNSVRPASLFCYNMMSYLDAKWARRIFPAMVAGGSSSAELKALLEKDKPDLNNRCGIRSIWNGRYRFSRYFAPNAFNTPTTLEALLANNDLEVYDLLNDPSETKNLAIYPQVNKALILELNNSMNQLIAEEVGVDDGSFLPIRNGTLLLAPVNER